MIFFFFLSLLCYSIYSFFPSFQTYGERENEVNCGLSSSGQDPSLGEIPNIDHKMISSKTLDIYIVSSDDDSENEENPNSKIIFKIQFFSTPFSIF